jgi:hypothetical protein
MEADWSETEKATWSDGDDGGVEANMDEDRGRCRRPEIADRRTEVGMTWSSQYLPIKVEPRETTCWSRDFEKLMAEFKNTWSDGYTMVERTTPFFLNSKFSPMSASKHMSSTEMQKAIECMMVAMKAQSTILSHDTISSRFDRHSRTLVLECTLRTFTHST